MRGEEQKAGMAWLFFSPSGRTGRQVFFMTWLFWVMVNSATLAKLFAHRDNEESLALWFLVFLAVLAVSVFSLLMSAVKRLHDLGAPALLAIVIFIPAISLIVFLLLCILPGNPGGNLYGPSTNRPKHG